ncbi:MAG: ABC transporter permease [Candidatus Sumerlaeaceae bacterium]|nr:ABC transporter permease [Candidatus Sumerlaeaceae bacterium]
MGKILAIALNTFKEAVRNKVLYFLLIFALLIMGFSSVISDLSIAAPEKMVIDLGLGAIDFFGFLISVFVGIYLIYNEMERKTIYTIVSKPIDRQQFILGKYFGLLITVYVNIAIMSIFFFTVLYFREATQPDVVTKAIFKELGPGKFESVGNYYVYHVQAFFIAAGKGIATLFGYWEPITHHLLRVVFMSAMSLAIITAFAILYSTFSTPTLSAVFTFLTFIIGNLCEDILRYADKLAQKAGGVAQLVGPDKMKYWFAMVATHITPNLALLDKFSDAVHGPWDAKTPTIHSVPIDWVVVVYGITYVAGVLSLACLIFNRRNFK